MMVQYRHSCMDGYLEPGHFRSSWALGGQSVNIHLYIVKFSLEMGGGPLWLD